jgi:hypothetical protein
MGNCAANIHSINSLTGGLGNAERPARIEKSRILLTPNDVLERAVDGR